MATLQREENDSDVGYALNLQRELQTQLEQKELKWRQRAKINWLTFGNRNSKFFHACANQRRKANKISQIQDENGRIYEVQKEIREVFANYFNCLFSTNGVVDYKGCLEALEGRVTETMNESLVRPFTEEEIKRVLFQMAPLKSPGLDGFKAGFFQKN